MKITKNELKNYNCIQIGYCEGWHLLRYAFKLGSASGIYGWNYNAYIVDFEHDYVITTGYRGMVGASPKISISKFENAARLIQESNRLDCIKKQEKTNILLKRIC